MKTRIGELIELKNETNVTGLDLPFYGLNKDKTISPTVANVAGVNNKKYKILRRGYFAINGMHAGRDNALAIGYWDNDSLGLVSPAYTTFSVKNSIINPKYFFMIFNSKEMDRYCGFLCDSSIRGGLDWNIFCNIEIDLPPLEIQKKYISIYDSTQKNLDSIERGQIDAENVCDLLYEKIKNNSMAFIGEILFTNNRRNSNSELGLKDLRGINENGEFMKSRDTIGEANLDTYNIVEKDQFVMNFMCLGNFGKFYYAYNNEKPYIVSPACTVFEYKKEQVDPNYLLYIFSRPEFQRKCVFMGDGNTRGGISIKDFLRIKIPLPSLQEQKIIGDIFNAYFKRNRIYNTTKNNIKNLCPILIKGAMKEVDQNL